MLQRLERRKVVIKLQELRKEGQNVAMKKKEEGWNKATKKEDLKKDE